MSIPWNTSKNRKIHVIAAHFDLAMDILHELCDIYRNAVVGSILQTVKCSIGFFEVGQHMKPIEFYQSKPCTNESKNYFDLLNNARGNIFQLVSTLRSVWNSNSGKFEHTKQLQGLIRIKLKEIVNSEMFGWIPCIMITVVVLCILTATKDVDTKAFDEVRPQKFPKTSTELAINSSQSIAHPLNLPSHSSHESQRSETVVRFAQEKVSINPILLSQYLI